MIPPVMKGIKGNFEVLKKKQVIAPPAEAINNNNNNFQKPRRK